MEKQRSFIAGLLIRPLTHFLYMAGLSIIIPLLFLVFFPSKWSVLAVQAKSIIYFAVALVLISALILFFYNRSVGRTFFFFGFSHVYSWYYCFDFLFSRQGYYF